MRNRIRMPQIISTLAWIKQMKSNMDGARPKPIFFWAQHFRYKPSVAHVLRR
jgi:hypothetical protein